MTIKKGLIAIIALFGFTALNAQKIVNVTTELQRLYDVGKMPEYMEGTLVKQISSYDRTGGNDDGFSGKYSFLRKNEDGTLVLFDEKGQGVIERIWTPTPTNDTLDFYFDGSSTPGLSIRFRDLFTGEVAPFLKPVVDYHLVGGYYSYIPIPYAKGCKIVLRGKELQFHQIQFREYDAKYKVETFSPKFTPAQNKILSDIVTLWKNPERTANSFHTTALSNQHSSFSLKPGETREIANLTQGGRILGLELRPASAFEGLERNVDLRITWDNESTPAVHVPVADFFGYAFGEKSMKSVLIGADEAKAYSYMPMPFDSKAKVELVYRKTENPQQKELQLNSLLSFSTQKRNPATEGRFYVQWNDASPALGSPWSFLKGNGKGHYVGTVLISQATDYEHFTEFFEGDDQTIVDGKLLVHGTGSEDYFNGGWYAQPGGWVERLGGPLSGCLDYSLPLGRTGGYRIFISDKMPFYQQIDHNIEHGPVNNNRKVHYSSAGMYYANAPVQKTMVPTVENTSVFIPDTAVFYTRLMRHLTYNGGFGWTDGGATLHENSNSVMNININELPAGKYKIYLNVTGSETADLEARIFDATRKQDWQKVNIEKGRGARQVLIGETEVREKDIPTSILFRSTTTNPGVSFDRVTFTKI